MSHFYRQRGEYGAKLLKSVATFPQARKHGACAPSITTVLGFIPSPFMQKWREKRIHELAGVYDYEEASEQAWGMRECPITGNVIPSAEFGTNGHSELELASQRFESQWKKGEGFPLFHYEKWVHLWIGWLSANDITVLHCEKMLFDEERNIAGTVDFIGEMDGNVFIADYKFRDSADKFYPKDCEQLAWAADVTKRWLKLTYTPRIYSVVFNSTLPADMNVKLWTVAAQKKALRRVNVVSRFVNELELNEQ